MKRKIRRQVVVLAADIAGFGRLINADEAGTRQRVEWLLHEAIEPAVNQHGGTVEEMHELGFLAAFSSPVEAVRAAFVLQHYMVGYNLDVPKTRWIQFKIGLAFGDLVIDDAGDGIYGDAVTTAEHLVQLAQPGGIYISGSIYDAVKDHLVCSYQSVADPLHGTLDDSRIYRVSPARGVRESERAWLRPVAVGAACLLVLGVAGGGWYLLQPQRQQLAEVMPPASSDTGSRTAGIAPPKTVFDATPAPRAEATPAVLPNIPPMPQPDAPATPASPPLSPQSPPPTPSTLVAQPPIPLPPQANPSSPAPQPSIPLLTEPNANSPLTPVAQPANPPRQPNPTSPAAPPASSLLALANPSSPPAAVQSPAPPSSAGEGDTPLALLEPPVRTHPTPAPAPARPAWPARSIEPEMVQISGGTFHMGSREDPSEQPVHTVTVRSFWLGKYPVTVREWRACMADHVCPDIVGASQADAEPITNVSWQDATTYLGWLSRVTGKRYRLPSEAEWEYAARGGTSSRYWWGNALGVSHANCSQCGPPNVHGGQQPLNVGSFPANPFGLFDMGGGVAQWLEDCWHPNYAGAPTNGAAWGCRDPEREDHVLRGGSWMSDPSTLRVSDREHYEPDVRYPGNGFRVALSE